MEVIDETSSKVSREKDNKKVVQTNSKKVQVLQKSYREENYCRGELYHPYLQIVVNY